MNDIERYKKRREDRLKKRMDGFNENDHPRDENGRFTSGGGSGGAKSGDVVSDLKKTVTGNESADIQTGEFVKKFNELPKGTSFSVGGKTYTKTGKDTWRDENKKLASRQSIYKAIAKSKAKEETGKKQESGSGVGSPLLPNSVKNGIIGRSSPGDRRESAVMGSGNKWAIENWKATH